MNLHHGNQRKRKTTRRKDRTAKRRGKELCGVFQAFSPIKSIIKTPQMTVSFHFKSFLQRDQEGLVRARSAPTLNPLKSVGQVDSGCPRVFVGRQPASCWGTNAIRLCWCHGGVCLICRGLWTDGVCLLASTWISGSRVSRQSVAVMWSVWFISDVSGLNVEVKLQRAEVLLVYTQNICTSWVC